jgi:hypothetical protein
MNSKLYSRAYRFLKIRATEPGQCTPFRALEGLTTDEKSLIYKFLSYNHQVKFI